MDRFLTAEHDRQLQASVMIATVHSADYASALVRLETGDLITGWIPWVTLRAGADRTWWAPDIGEQVLLLAPGGAIEQAVALGALYQDAHPAPEASPDRHVTLYQDGSRVEFNRATGDLTISVTGDVTITAGGDIRLTGQRIDLN